MLPDSNIIDVVDMLKMRVYFDRVKQWKLFICCGIILLLVLVQRNILSRGDTYRNEPLKWRRDGNQNKHILVTGAAGFIGHYVVMKLKRHQVKIIGIDNFNDYYNVSLKYLRSNISGVVLYLDVCDSTGVTNLINAHNITHVIHMAAQAGVRYSLSHPQAYVRSNLECFVQLLQVIKLRNIKLIYASSSSVYGENTEVPFSENHRVDQPVSLYAATKRENELMAHVYWHLYKVHSVGLRFFTVYGPMGRPDMAYFLFVKNIDERKPIQVYNYGKLSRDFTYIDDIVDGIVNCIDVQFDCEILNLGRGQPQNLMTFIETIERFMGKKAILNFVKMAKGDVLTTYADISKAQRAIEYNPQVSLKEGIQKFVNWYKSAK
jgi:UDP-glucuronate 4-epimerase